MGTNSRQRQKRQTLQTLFLEKGNCIISQCLAAPEVIQCCLLLMSPSIPLKDFTGFDLRTSLKMGLRIPINDKMSGIKQMKQFLTGACYLKFWWGRITLITTQPQIN